MGAHLDQPQVVCINRDCNNYGLAQITDNKKCSNCHCKLKPRDGNDEPDNVVDGDVKSYGYRKKNND